MCTYRYKIIRIQNSLYNETLLQLMVITSFIVFYTGLWLAGFMISDYDNLRYKILVPNNAVSDLILSTDYKGK